MIKMRRIVSAFIVLFTSITAWATDPVTKTYAFSTMTTSNGNTISANDPEDNNSSKAIIIAQDENSKISKVDFLNYIQIANMSGVGGTGADAEFLIYPYINGKVTQIVFTNVSRPSLLGSESFSMRIAGMKYNGTDDALTGVSSSQSTATFTSTNSEGISGNLTMTLSAYSQLQLNSGSEIRITYIPAAEEPHQHNFSFNASGNTLTATCAHNDGKECSLAGEDYKATLTLTANGGHYYPEVNYSASHDLVTFNAKTGLSATAGDITITNQDTSESTTGSVHDVGRYTATLTVTIDDTDYELRKGFSIHMGIITCDYPQFSFSPAEPSEGDEVTITFTPQWGDESIQTFTMRGVEGNMSIGSGITDKGDGTYTFTMPDGALFVEATFTTPSAAHFAQDGDTYTIKSVGGWRYFCHLIKEGLAPDGFSGKIVKLDANVSSPEMVGTSGHPFKGTFDGQNYTLTFNRTAAEHFSAPFHYINGATISNLHVEGTITGGTYESLGGLVGHAEGHITINNCRVSTEISTTVSGSASHGGVIAQWNGTNATCTVTGCVYDGLIYNPNEAGVTTSCRGFIGWDYGNNGTITFTDCLSAPAAYGTGKYALGNNCFTFVYPNSEPTLTYNMTNCYYTSILGNRQGRPAATATVAPANLGNATDDHGMVDGYENGFLYDGNYYTPKYGDLVVEYRFNDWNERADVTLSDRTLYKDGNWNTLCLPFSLSAAQIAANANFAGATLMTMDVTEKNGFDVEDGTLYLWFKKATEIEAGVPYLVKWEKAMDYEGNEANYDISNPVFEGVTISNSTAQTVESETTGLEAVQMVGTYSPVSVTANDKSILFLGDANTLYYSTVDRQIRSCRAYFSVPYINGHAEAKARAFALSFDGEETTGILEVSANYNGVTDEAWYSLDGVRLSGKPTQRGMYINKGKKILVK